MHMVQLEKEHKATQSKAPWEESGLGQDFSFLERACVFAKPSAATQSWNTTLSPQALFASGKDFKCSAMLHVSPEGSRGFQDYMEQVAHMCLH